MVKDLADLAPVELEVRMRKVRDRDPSDEQDHPGVVNLAVGVKGVVAKLVPVRLVVDVVLLLPGVSVRVRREDVMMAAQ
jgi:hypothetical protein